MLYDCTLQTGVYCSRSIWDEAATTSTPEVGIELKLDLRKMKKWLMYSGPSSIQNVKNPYQQRFNLVNSTSLKRGQTNWVRVKTYFVSTRFDTFTFWGKHPCRERLYHLSHYQKLLRQRLLLFFPAWGRHWFCKVSFSRFSQRWSSASTAVLLI